MQFIPPELFVDIILKEFIGRDLIKYRLINKEYTRVLNKYFTFDFEHISDIFDPTKSEITSIVVNQIYHLDKEILSSPKEISFYLYRDMEGALTDKILSKKLQKFVKLTRLKLANCVKITNEFMKNDFIKNLEYFSYNGDKITEYSNLKKCKDLEFNNEISSKFEEQLDSYIVRNQPKYLKSNKFVCKKKLICKELDGAIIPDTVEYLEVASIKDVNILALTNITVLKLGNFELSSIVEGYLWEPDNILLQFTKLKILHLNNWSINNINGSTLEELSLINCSSLNGRSFRDCENIKNLSMINCKHVSDINMFAGCKKIVLIDNYASFDLLGPNIKEFKCKGGFHNFNNLVNCEKLSFESEYDTINSCNKIYKKIKILSCIKSVCPELNNFENCTRITCSGSPVSDDDICKIADKLIEFVCDDTRITNLNKFTRCKHISCDRCIIDNKSIKNLGSEIIKFSCARTHITDFNHLVNCRYLNCNSCGNVTIDSIIKMKKLATVCVWNTRLEGKEELKKLKNIKLIGTRLVNVFTISESIIYEPND